MAETKRRLGARRLYSDEYLVIVKGVLATMPPPRLGPGTDLDVAVADLAQRIVAVYPRPEGGLTHVWNAGAGVFGQVVGTADDLRRAAAFLKAIPPNVTFAPISIR